MARLSLCLIARDEEAMLPGCLESVRGVADEVVLVDTGSTDRTADVARAAGAIVLARPWDDDFSAPRNLAAGRASGDWILQLDCDERLAPGSGAALRRALSRRDLDVGFLRFHDAARTDAPAAEVVGGAARLARPYRLPRLLRRDPGLRWRGLVHESVMDWAASRGNRLRELDVDVVHLGYAAAAAGSRAKSDRNLALLRRRAELEPDDPTALGYLALDLLGRGQRDEAAALAARGWALVPSQPAHRSVRRLALVRAALAIEAGRAGEARDAVDVAEARDGANPDFSLARGLAAELEAFAAPAGGEARAAALGRAERAYAEALARLRDGVGVQVLFAGEAEALLRRGVVLGAAGRHREARASFEAALAAGGGEPAAVGLAEALARLGEAPRALALLEPLLGATPEPWLAAALAAAALGAPADARLLLRRAVERAPAGFRSPHHREAHRELAAALGSAP